MSCLTAEEKETLKYLYKVARKIVHSESHIQFLEKCLEFKYIPKSFQIKKFLPGDQKVNQERFDKISNDCINDEKVAHTNKLNWARAEFCKIKSELNKVFSDDAVISETKRLEKHMQKISIERRKIQESKLQRNQFLDDNSNIVVCDDESLPDGWNNLFVTNQEKSKKKRRFRRKWLQPQPKKMRKRRRNQNDESVPEGWNSILKNISGVPVTSAEESLFLRGKKFCPVELDPPFIRMQRELNCFFRILRMNGFSVNIRMEDLNWNKSFTRNLTGSLLKLAQK
jgi:hypothetical protein